MEDVPQQVLAAIAEYEGPCEDGGFHCDNATIVTATGLGAGEVASALDRLWAAGEIEGVLTLGALWPHLLGIYRVLPGRDRIWGVDGRYKPRAGS